MCSSTCERCDSSSWRTKDGISLIRRWEAVGACILMTNLIEAESGRAGQDVVRRGRRGGVSG